MHHFYNISWQSVFLVEENSRHVANYRQRLPPIVMSMGGAVSCLRELPGAEIYGNFFLIHASNS